MSATAVAWLACAATLGCGAVSGVFFTFSTFTMQGLARLPAPQGVAAMQSINVTAVRPAFMTLLFGSGVVSAVLAVLGLASWQEQGPFLVVGAFLYLVGTVGVTMARNVPLNTALADLHPDGVSEFWGTYVRRWTWWNHVRTLSSLGASAAFLAAVAQG